MWLEYILSFDNKTLVLVNIDHAKKNISKTENAHSNPQIVKPLFDLRPKEVCITAIMQVHDAQVVQLYFLSDNK